MTTLFNQKRVVLNNCLLTDTLSIAAVEQLSREFAASDPWRTLNISATSLKNCLLRQDAHLYRYLVQVNDQVAGIICLRYPWLRGPYIELLGLIECYRGHGIGTELLHWLETEAKPHTNNIWLAASSFNHSALHFYQSHGFQQIGVVEGLVHADYDELLFRKCLK